MNYTQTSFDSSVVERLKEQLTSKRLVFAAGISDIGRDAIYLNPR